MFFKTKSGSTYMVDPARRTLMGPGTRNEEVALLDVLSPAFVGGRFSATILMDGVQKQITTSEVAWVHA